MEESKHKYIRTEKSLKNGEVKIILTHARDCPCGLERMKEVKIQIQGDPETIKEVTKL